MAENDRPSAAPVLLIDLRIVFRRNRAHGFASFFMARHCGFGQLRTELGFDDRLCRLTEVLEC
jgi:hypothetical protein